METPIPASMSALNLGNTNLVNKEQENNQEYDKDAIIQVWKCPNCKILNSFEQSLERQGDCINTHNKNGFCDFNFQTSDLDIFENLVDVTVFLTDMKNDFDTYNKVYSDYFMNNQPCRTTVEVSSLPTTIAIELKCIATID